MSSYLLVALTRGGAFFKVHPFQDGVFPIFLADGQNGLLALALAGIVGRPGVEQIQLDAAIMQAVTEDTTFENIADAANAIDVASLSDEEKAALQEELQGVLGGLMGYFSTLQPAA